MMTCPKTGRAAPTGIAFGSVAAFDATKLQNITVRCSQCGENHVVDNATVKLFPNEP